MASRPQVTLDESSAAQYVLFELQSSAATVHRELSLQFANARSVSSVVANVEVGYSRRTMADGRVAGGGRLWWNEFMNYDSDSSIFLCLRPVSSHLQIIAPRPECSFLTGSQNDFRHLNLFATLVGDRL